MVSRSKSLRRDCGCGLEGNWREELGSKKLEKPGLRAIKDLTLGQRKFNLQRINLKLKTG